MGVGGSVTQSVRGGAGGTVGHQNSDQIKRNKSFDRAVPSSEKLKGELHTKGALKGTKGDIKTNISSI